MERDRSTYIGGSDAPGVLGYSRWDTPLSVWARKTGLFNPPEEDNEAQELGRELEDYVARRFTKKTGIQLKKAEGLIVDPEYPWLAANVDRLTEDGKAGFEAKTASAWKAKEWEGEEIPQEYVIQCYHYMMVTGLKTWHLACLIGNQDYKIKKIEWDSKVIKEMREREIEFWTLFVEPKVMPGKIMWQDSETLQGLYPMAEESKEIELTDEANILIEGLTSMKEEVRQIEHQIEQSENSLKAMLGDADSGSTSLYTVKWSNQRMKRIDTKLIEARYPEIAKICRIEKNLRRFSYKRKLEETKP